MDTPNDLPRVPLGTFPTPLHAAPRLSDALGVEVWLKRDDLTGFGLGGNKVRGLEYLLADAERSGCDCVVTGGKVASNWAMLAALAARVRGLDSVLVYAGAPVAAAGNQLLARSIGAEVRFTGDPDRTSVDEGVERAAAELRAAGRRPYALGRGGATPLASVAYALATTELAAQLAEAGVRPAQLWLATGSCGTHAGLVAGRPGYDVVGVSVSRPIPECRERIARLATGARELLGLAPADGHAPIRLVDGPVEPDDVAAATEGVFLDPIFAGRAMAGLHAAARGRAVRGPVVFLVSGGAPTLFS